MKKDDQIILTITDMGVDGAGIGKLDGMAFFVKDAVIGDTVLAKVMKLKKTYGYAKLLEVMEPSSYRVKPECPLHRPCGGCQLQALSYDKQLEFKENKIRNNLIRIGGFDLAEIPMQPIIGAKKTYHYRNKAQFPVGRDKFGNIAAGFYASRTHSLIPVDNCLLGVPQNQVVMDAVLTWMRDYQIQPYDEQTGTGLVRHVLIRYGFFSTQLMVCLVINGKSLPKAKPLVEKLREIEGMTSISISVNEQRNNVIMGDTVQTLWGNDYIEDSIGGVKFQISPLSFYQVNPVQTEKLYGLVLEYAGLTGEETVWDLYCGIGTISLFLAGKAKKVYGVEIIPQAVADAWRNAKINGISNVEFIVGKAETILPQFYGQASGSGRTDGDICRMPQERKEDYGKLHPQVIVVDPPRKGCGEELLDTIAKMRPNRVVYVSCDSATLARDLKYLCGCGYRMEKVRGVDLFCQGVHVETVILLSQQKANDAIEVDLDLDELDLTSAETKATYQKIKEYVLKEYGLKVSSLYISQTKRKYGLDVRENYNHSKKENPKVPRCTSEKEEAILAALKYFAMI